MDTRKLKPWLVLALVFLAGLVMGIVLARGIARHYLFKAAANPDGARAHIVAKVEREVAFKLKLDDAQKARLHEVLARSTVQIKALREEFGPRFHSILTNAEADLGAVLTPEQQAQLKELIRKNQAFLRPR